jgi:hypothetical protein
MERTQDGKQRQWRSLESLFKPPQDGGFDPMLLKALKS